MEDVHYALKSSGHIVTTEWTATDHVQSRISCAFTFLYLIT